MTIPLLLTLLFSCSVASTELESTRPCPLYNISYARRLSATIMNKMQLISTHSLENFEVSATTSRGIFNVTSRLTGAQRLAERQFCQEWVRLNVDLSRDPPVQVESGCISHNISCESGLCRRQYQCATRKIYTQVRERRCSVRYRTEFVDDLRTRYLRTDAGCRVIYTRSSSRSVWGNCVKIVLPNRKNKNLLKTLKLLIRDAGERGIEKQREKNYKWIVESDRESERDGRERV